MSDMQPSDREIVKRVPGYTNDMMIKDCEIMHGVLTKTKEVIVGRGKQPERKRYLPSQSQPTL